MTNVVHHTFRPAKQSRATTDSSASLDPKQSKNKLVIIGGGITGLYAALRALDCGQSNIHIYEASTVLGGKIKSRFLRGQLFNMCASKAVIALPTYALCRVQGLQHFGLDDDYREGLSKIQYASLVKFTLPLRLGNEIPNVNLFSTDVQSYQPAPGYMTFLCRVDGEIAVPALIKHHLDMYAGSLGKTADEVFDASPQNTICENPRGAPCFSTPSPVDKVKTDCLLARLEGVAEQGLAIVGTFYPLEGAVGFMECGLAAVERAHERLYASRHSFRLVGNG